MSTKVLVGCGIGCVVALMLAVGAAWFGFGHVMSGALGGLTANRRPADLEQAKVVSGAGRFSKRVVWTDPSLGAITDITMGQLDGKPGSEIGLAGTDGAVLLTERMGAQQTVQFPGSRSHVDVVDVEGDGVCEFMDRGSWSHDVALFDHSGKLMWSYGGTDGVDDMSGGDIDGDGRLEFAVGFNGGGGVHLVDSAGRRLWRRRDGNVWHVEVSDLDGDGTAEIIHSNAGGEMTVRGATGQVIRRSRPPAYFSDFSLCRWPTQMDRQYALFAEDDTIWLLDEDGKAAAKFGAPSAGTLGEARGTVVWLPDKQHTYLAVLVDLHNYDRAILYLYDRAGKLVYQEILPESCAAIAALPLFATRHVLLVGGQGRVIEYQMASGADKP